MHWHFRHPSIPACKSKVSQEITWSNRVTNQLKYGLAIRTCDVEISAPSGFLVAKSLEFVHVVLDGVGREVNVVAPF